MTIVNMSRPYWSDGAYYINLRYKTGSSFGQGRLEASTEKCVIVLAHTIAEKFNYDYTNKG